MLTAQGMEVAVVTYTVVCDAMRRYYADDFDPNKCFSVGERIFIPVYVKAYKKERGTSYMLKLMKKEVVMSSRGVRF